MAYRVSIALNMFFGIFLSLNAALADEMYGIFMVTKGVVKVQSVKSGSLDARVGSKVFEGDTITTGTDARAKIVMSDRNVINVNPDTKIQIAKYQNDSVSGKKNVELKLLQGKVRNNVEQTYDGEKSKFLIKTPTAVAGVRGTQFLAGFDPTTQLTSVVTFKGSVALASVSPQGQTIGTPVVVKKGEMTTAAPNKAPEPPKVLPKEEVKKLDVETASATQNKESTKETKEVSVENKKEVAKENNDNKNESKKDVPTDGNVDGKKDLAKEPTKDGKAKEGAVSDSGAKKDAPGNNAAQDGPTGGNNREPSSTTNSSNGNSASSQGTSNSIPAPGPMAEVAPAPKIDAPAAPTMIDKKDLDVGVAKDIGAIKGAPLSPPPPQVVKQPQTTAPTGTTPITDIIRDNMGKSKVIIQPRIPQ